MRLCQWQFPGVGLCSATCPTNGRLSVCVLSPGQVYQSMSEKTNRANICPLKTVEIATLSFCNHAEAAGQLMALCRGLRTRIQRQRELGLVF